MNVQKATLGVVGAVALGALLAACSSSGSGQSDSLAALAGAPAPVTVSPAVNNTVPTPTVPTRNSAAAITVQAHPAPEGQGQVGFGGSAVAPSAPSRGASGSVTLSGPITFSAVSFPGPYDCAESGTTYYNPPNVAVAMDVTVLANSPALANGLTVTAPNPAPRGISNASHLMSSAALGNGVWRATYRTWVSLYQPRFTPVTVSSLAASSGGNGYTITFRSPVTVTIDDCHS